MMPRLALVELPRFGRLEPPKRAAPNEAERLVRALEATHGRMDLAHQGSQFQLVSIERAAQLPGRDSYEALHAQEAQRVLKAMASYTQLSPSARELLEKAVPLLVPSHPSAG